MNDSSWFDDEEDRAARGDGGAAQQQQLAEYDATAYDPGWQQQPQLQLQQQAQGYPAAPYYDPSAYFDASQLPVPDDPSYLTQPVQTRVSAANSGSSAAAHPGSWAAPAAPMLSAADLVAEAEQFQQTTQQQQQQLQLTSEFEQSQAEEGAWSATAAAACSSSFAAPVLPWRGGAARGGGRGGGRGGRGGSARGGRGGGRGGGAGGGYGGSSSGFGGGSSSGYSFGLTPAAAASSSSGFGSGSRGGYGGRGGRGGRGDGGGNWSSRNNSAMSFGGAFPLNSVYSNQASEPGYSVRFGSEQDRIKDEEFMGPDLDFGEEGDSGFVPLGGGASSSAAAAPAADASAPAPAGLPRTDARGHTIVTSHTLPITVLPERFRCVFSYPSFNRVQSTCFQVVFNGDKNIIVSAPTGSGKTVIFELALLRFFKDELLNPEHARKLGGIAAAQPLTGPELAAAAAAGGADDSFGGADEVDMTSTEAAASAAPAAPAKPLRIGEKKVVYLAPLKALCDERFQDWVHRLTLTLGLQIVQMTSDNPVNPWKLKRANIIITTGEKWDVISRRQEDADVRLVRSVGLLLVDEVHMLNQAPRGAVLEGLMSRMIVRSQEARANTENPLWRHPIAALRILGLSATAPNAADVAEWLGAAVFSFQNNLRPVPIEYKCYSYFCSGNAFVFENSLNNRLLELIRQHGAGRPTLIFVSTRKATYLAAQCILDQVQKLGLLTDLVNDDGQALRLNSALHNLPDSTTQMANLLRCGIGVHHGGLSPTERHTIEALFTNGDLKVVCATSTLGQGVNLPAHMVIIRGTSHWNGKDNVELDSSTIMQMIGRAGRPQYDKEGVALVMTSQDKFDRYNKILEGQPIESRLWDNMIEHLNSEIVAAGSAGIPHLMHWMKSTFMFTRMKKNPVEYFKRWADEREIENALLEKLNEMVKQLVDNRLVERLPEQEVFRGTGLAVLMARWYLCFKTVCLFNNIAEDSTFQDFLEIFAKAEEWNQQEFKIKAGDKGVLNPLLVRRRKKAAAHAQAQTLEQELAAVEPKFDEYGRPLDAFMPPPPPQPSIVDLEPDQLPYPPQGRRITTMADKLSVLVQVRCCGLTDKLANNFNLRSEMMSLTGPGARVAKAMCDYMIQRAEFDMATRGEGPAKNDPPGHIRTGWIALKNAIQFSKCVENSAFDDCPQIFAQLNRVGEVTARRLFSNCKSFGQLMLADPHVIAELSGHQIKWVQELLDMVHRDIPLYQAQISQLGYTPATQCARVHVSFSLFLVRDDAPKLRRPDQHLAHLIVGSLKKELFFYRRITASQLPFETTIDVPLGTQLKAYIIDDKIVGADSHNVAYLRYGTNINSQLDSNEFFRCLNLVTREFDKLENQKRKETPEEIAAALAAAAQAPESDAAAGGDDSAAGSRPMSKTAGFCKHKAGKCQAGQCKHVCCHTRAQAQGDLGAKWPNPLFTQDVDDDDMAGGAAASVFGASAAPASRKISGAAARSNALREKLQDELIISQAQLGSKRLRLGSSAPSPSNAGAYWESEAARSVARDNTLTHRFTQRIAQQQEMEQSQQLYAQYQPQPPQQHYPSSCVPAAAAASAAHPIPQVQWSAVDPSTPQLSGGGGGSSSAGAYLKSLFTSVRPPSNRWAAAFEDEDPCKSEVHTPAQIALRKRKCPIGH